MEISTWRLCARHRQNFSSAAGSPGATELYSGVSNVRHGFLREGTIGLSLSIPFLLTHNVLRYCLAVITALLAFQFCDTAQECSIMKGCITCESVSFFGVRRREVYDAPAVDVSIHKETLLYIGDGFMVIISLEDGCEVFLTPACTVGPRK